MPCPCLYAAAPLQAGSTLPQPGRPRGASGGRKGPHALTRVCPHCSWQNISDKLPQRSAFAGAEPAPCLGGMRRVGPSLAGMPWHATNMCARAAASYC